MQTLWIRRYEGDGINKVRLKRKRYNQEIMIMLLIEYAQPIKISCFDKDIAGLAVKLNEYVVVQQQLSAEYVKERAKLNTMVSGVSHDFRTPLTASLGHLQLIEKAVNDPIIIKGISQLPCKRMSI